MLEVKMHDGSIFRMPNESWQEALDLKYAEMGIADLKSAFRDEVRHHWETKTVPTKFHDDDSWEEFFSGSSWPQFDGRTTFKDHADLGFVVMYQHIRVPMMGIALAKMSKEEGKESPGAIGVHSDGSATVYKDGKKKKFDSFEDALKEDEKE